MQTPTITIITIAFWIINLLIVTISLTLHMLFQSIIMDKTKIKGLIKIITGQLNYSSNSNNKFFLWISFLDMDRWLFEQVKWAKQTNPWKSIKITQHYLPLVYQLKCNFPPFMYFVSILVIKIVSIRMFVSPIIFDRLRSSLF